MSAIPSSDVLAAALGLARRKVPVFPCRPDKSPHTHNGFKSACRNQRQIEAWWSTYPAALIGMPTGKASKRFVIDIDVKNGKPGEESILALQRKHGALPPTLEARTGSGGRHLHFRYPQDGRTIKNSVEKLAPGVDVRGEGGYVIVPPGTGYSWAPEIPANGALPDPAEAPEWLLQLVCDTEEPSRRPPGRTARRCNGGTPPRTVHAGERNDVMFRLASSLRAKGLTEPAIRAALLEENQARCAPPLPEDEVARIARSAGRYEPGQTINWPAITPLPEGGGAGDAPPFPVDVLPAAVRDACREVARFVRVPEAAPAIVGLATIATAIGKRASVVERPGLTHHPALFFAGIAESGERKSPVFRVMAEPLEDWVELQKPAWEEASREAKARNAAIEAAIAKAKKPKEGAQNLEAVAGEIARLEARRLPVPPWPRLFTSDATEQRLFQLMHQRDGAFAVLSGEGRPVVDAIMGKYSGEKRTGDALYLAGITGDTITRDRVGGESGPEERVIRRPCLNVCVMVQPDKYLEAAGHRSLRASGALARIWSVWLPSMAGTRFESADEHGLNPFALNSYRRLVSRILDHEGVPEWICGPQPHKARLSTEAADARRGFHNQVERLMAAGCDYEDVKDIASKAVSQTAKLALVLHIAENPAVLDQLDSEISRETWMAAQTLGQWFLNEAIRVQRMAEEDVWVERARRVLSWLQRERFESVTSIKLTQSEPRPRLKANEADRILDMLADHGYLRAERPDGRKKPVFYVNPASFSQIS